jgi:hypothetical protein
MRVLFGMILGALLTVGGAYVYDSRAYDSRMTGGPAAIERPMVNWDVVGKNWTQFTTRVRGEWNRLVG